MWIIVASKSTVEPARNVEHQVQRPAQSELNGECDESTKWIVQVFGVPSKFGFGFRDKDFILLEGTDIRMMAVMAIFPREVRDKERGMQDEANSIIKPLVIIEGMVPTFMCYDPNANQDATLEGQINWSGQVRERMRKGVEIIGSNVI